MKPGIDALRENDIPALKRAIELDPSLARKPQLVVEAARMARLQALKVLVRQGADVNAGWRGYRPLHALIQENPHTHAREPERGRLKCLEWLLSNGADPELPGAWPPARALLVAAFIGVPIYVECLVAAGALRDAFVASAMGNLARVRVELREDPSLPLSRDANGLSALQCCAASRLGADDKPTHRKLLEIATLLLDAGADPTLKTKSWSHEVDPVYFAVSAGNGEMIELLLARGADATAALVAAAWQEDDRFAQICLRCGAQVNQAKDGDRPLLNEMIRWGRLQWVIWLLERGADPNLPDSRGWTAVHQAASRGNAHMFKAVVAAGGDLRRKDLAGKTPLGVANLATRAVLSGP